MVAFERATLKMQFLDKLMKDCGLEHSVKGDMTIRQVHTFIGIVFDALRGRLFISKENFDKTMKLLHDMMHQVECRSPRVMAKLRGKFGHQFRSGCIEGVGPFLVPFNQFVSSPETVREWDEPKPISDHLCKNMGILYRWLPELQVCNPQVRRCGRWIRPRSYLSGTQPTFSRGTSGRGLLGCLSSLGRPYYPSSAGSDLANGRNGIRSSNDYCHVSGSDQSTGALGISWRPIALQILSSLMDLRGWHVLFVNDCLPVILAMRKGSQSQQLQFDSESVAVGILEAGAKASYLHVPGT
jgi:hypothetical protein